MKRAGLVAVAVLMSANGCAGPSQRGEAGIVAAVPDAEWEGVFTRSTGWNGGDIAHSIDVGDGRVLWLFGDSLAGTVQNGARVGDGMRFLRGAIAWHQFAPGEIPKAVNFAGPEAVDGMTAAAWTKPQEGLFPAGSWYWLMNDGVRLRQPRDRLVLFATAIGPSGNPDGMWNFRRVGGAVIVVENPQDAPDQWIGRQTVNPLVTATPKFGEAKAEGDNWAAAIVEWPQGSDSYFIFGVHTHLDGTQTLEMATAAGGELAEPTKWKRDAHAAAGPRVPDEFTIETVKASGRTELVLIYSEPFANRSVWARTARRPDGPWSEARAVYDIPDYGPGTFIYAAKGHAHLSRPGELLISCAVNADWQRVMRDTSVYRPKFVRVPLSIFPEPPR